MQIYRTEFNSTTVNLNFESGGPINMSFEMHGSFLPSNYEINVSALEAIYTPAPIQNKYVQLPPDIDVYKANNPFFFNHFQILDGIIDSNDNAFMVANKIRNYLQYQFTFPTDPADYNPPPDGRDIVDWFCETQQGVWSDFAAAFCVFTRAFGVASRFVNGFHSQGIQEVIDNEWFQPTFAIKYANLYNWAEIYVPTDYSGTGQWVQMDIMFDSFGTGGNPWTPDNYSISVYSNFTAGYRDGNRIANITASLTLQGIPQVNRTITFIDSATDDIIGYGVTNSIGDTSILVPINNSQVVGPHWITAQYNPQIYNSTLYMIYGDIDVQLTDVNPQEVNISVSRMTNIQGYVVDPLNGIRVKSTTLEPLLLQKGTNIRVGSPPFDFPFFDTDYFGDFNIDVNVDPSVLVGQYDIRIDFNGSWYGGWPLAAGIMNDSSNRMDFNVTKGILKYVWFYINDVPSNNPNSPLVNRYETMVLKAQVVNETFAPMPNEVVTFYDHTRGFTIGSNTTDAFGITTFTYSLGIDSLSGPNLLYAKLGIEENYSYCILNEAPLINLISGPTPREINRTGSGSTNTQFNLIGNIRDATNGNPLRNTELRVKLMNGGVDYSSYLIPGDIIWTDFSGDFNYYFEVASNTPTGNYSIRIDFNGTIDYGWIAEYPFFFNNLQFWNTSSTFSNQLKVVAPTTLLFNFWIDGTDSQDYNQPVINRNGALNLSVYLEWGMTPIADGEWIEFYDVTQGDSIGFVQTVGGRAYLMYYTDISTAAGPHLIYARYGSDYNYSYFILDAPLEIDLTIGPSPQIVNRSGSIGTTFNLQGSVYDSLNGAPIKFCEIYVQLWDGPTDVSHYLILNSGSFQLDASGTFDMTFSVSDSTPAKNYTLRIAINGVFLYSWPNNQFNEHNFYLFSFTNFTDSANGHYDLMVLDPYQIDIYFFVDGVAARSSYSDGFPPERYNRGETINFTVFITQSGIPVTSGVVVLRDYFIDTQIGSYTFLATDNGVHHFLIPTGSWHAGLHQIRVSWGGYSTFNSTYVIINETIAITGSISGDGVIQRNVESFTFSGNVNDMGTNLRGLRVTILLLDSGLNDDSGYLNIVGGQTTTIDSNGNFMFSINSISLSCPHGQYYIRIDFNGSISESGIFLNDYMVHHSSILYNLNVTAGTVINGYYDTKVVKDQFYEGDELYVYGYLTWDNGTPIVSKEITIQIKNSLGDILASATGYTDGSGFFNITLMVGNWPNDAEVWANFYPENNYSYPEYYYIASVEQQVYREP